MTLVSTLLLLLSIFSMIGCDSGSSGNYNFAPPHSPNIELEEISNEKCMNLEKYLNLLKTSIGGQAARRISTEFEIKPFKQNQITKNFELRLGLGNFIFEDSTLSQFSELNLVTQTDCDTVVQTNSSGPEEYKITRADKKSISIKNQWEDEITYQWISPNQLTVISSFVSGDYLCSETSKGRVYVTKEILWGPAIKSKKKLSPGVIKESYLDLLANATGYSKSNLYLESESTPPSENETEIENGIYIHRLIEMSSQPIKPEALLCE